MRILLDERFDGGGIDVLGLFAGESEEDGAVSGVANARESEGAEEFGFDAGGIGETVGLGEIDGKLAGGAHRANGVRTRRGPMPILKRSKTLVFMIASSR